MARMWVRTCQCCGYKLKKPQEPSNARKSSAEYGFVACRKCKSEAYDYGSWHDDEQQEEG